MKQGLPDPDMGETTTYFSRRIRVDRARAISLEVVRKMGNSAAAEAQHTDMIQQQMADRYFSDHF